MAEKVGNGLDLLLGQVVEVKELAVARHNNLVALLDEAGGVDRQVRQIDGDDLGGLLVRIQLEELELPVQTANCQNILTRMRYDT